MGYFFIRITHFWLKNRLENTSKSINLTKNRISKKNTPIFERTWSKFGYFDKKKLLFLTQNSIKDVII